MGEVQVSLSALLKGHICNGKFLFSTGLGIAKMTVKDHKKANTTRQKTSFVIEEHYKTGFSPFLRAVILRKTRRTCCKTGKVARRKCAAM